MMMMMTMTKRKEGSKIVCLFVHAGVSEREEENGIEVGEPLVSVTAWWVTPWDGNKT